MILPSAFETNFVIVAFDGSEDHLVGRGWWALVGDEMVKFREGLRSQPLPASIKELVATITPPEGVKYVQRRMLFNRMFHGMRDLSASMGMKRLRMTMMRGGGGRQLSRRTFHELLFLALLLVPSMLGCSSLLQ